MPATPHARRRRRPFVSAEPLERRTLLAVFTVTSTANDGAGSLRTAIASANLTAAADTIEFDLGAGGPQTITVTGALPTISQPLTIDGTTQDGYGGAPLVSVAAPGAVNADGLTVDAPGCVVRGLAVSGFRLPNRSGVRLTANADGATVQNCYLGTNADGSASGATDRNWYGVTVDAGADNVTVGGLTSAADPANAPVANNEDFVVDEDAAISGNVLANDTDPNGDPLTAVLKSGPQRGTLDFNADGSFTYTPERDFFGLDTFTYAASDGLQEGAPATVGLILNAVADPGVFRFAADNYDAAENGGQIELTVLREGAEGFVTVDFALTAGTATVGADFASFAGTLFFDNGQIAASIFLAPQQDSISEPPETIVVMLSNPTNGAAVGSAGVTTVTIRDTPPQPGLSVADPLPVAEGNAGESALHFVVTLSAASDRPVTVNFHTGFNAATADVDYRPASGLLEFEPGQTTKTIPVTILGDTDNELDESLSVFLFAATNATLDDSFAFSSILNDDNLAPTAASLGVLRAPAAGPLRSNVLGSASDPNGDALQIRVNGQPAFGTATIDRSGTPFDFSDDTLVYTPAGLGLNDDRITYEIADDFGGVATATIDVRVRGTAMVPNATDPAAMDLVAVGTGGADRIRIDRTRNRADPREVRLTVNDDVLGPFSPAGRIIVAGLGGDDRIEANRKLAVGVDLFGGGGNDLLRGAKGGDLLFGGPGADRLLGGDRRDVLVGGAGPDRLDGGGSDDILIAGPASFEADAGPAALARADVLAAWTANPGVLARQQTLVDGFGPRATALDSSVLSDDGDRDVLDGRGGVDWLFGVPNDGQRQNPDKLKGKVGVDSFSEI